MGKKKEKKKKLGDFSFSVFPPIELRVSQLEHNQQSVSLSHTQSKYSFSLSDPSITTASDTSSDAIEKIVSQNPHFLYDGALATQTLSRSSSGDEKMRNVQPEIVRKL